LDRLSIAFIIACTVAAPGCKGAGEIDHGRIAIVDASINTTPYLDAFAKAGIKVIGRYYSRCPQPEIVPEKRLIDNMGEIEAIRSHGFGVLSIYQYFNNQPLKFAGKRKVSCRTKKGESRTIEVALPGPDCTPRPIEDCQEAEGPSHNGADEAELDARAAVAQAKLVGQPPGTAIYFGIDFDLKPELNEQGVQYFTIVSNALRDKGYLVGVYGSGAALALLKAERHKTGRHAGQPLVDFTWLNAARGHSGAADFYNRGEWDLFQSRIDLHLPVGTGTAEIDTDIQNAARDYVGVWDSRGQYRVPETRTKAVYDQHRFACTRHAPVREAPSKDAKSIGSLGLGRVVRIGEEQEGFVEVDRNEAGIYDGWTLLANLSPTFAERPEYVGGIGMRGDAACRTLASPATTASVR
jgi:glycoside hydrolase-like protein